MESNNFKKALDEAMEFIAKEYPSSVWKGDIHDFYALLIEANFTNQVFIDYLKDAIEDKAYLPNNVKCIVNKGKISQITIGGE